MFGIGGGSETTMFLSICVALISVGELMDLQGWVRYNRRDYNTPSGASKAIAATWREVNGWMLWKYGDN